MLSESQIEHYTAAALATLRRVEATLYLPAEVALELDRAWIPPPGETMVRVNAEMLLKYLDAYKPQAQTGRAAG